MTLFFISFEFNDTETQVGVAIGTKDCPGKSYKYTGGLCPENFSSRSMWKVGTGKKASKSIDLIRRHKI